MDTDDYAAAAISAHLTGQIAQFLKDFELNEEWIGVVVDYDVETSPAQIEYNVRAVDGPYTGQLRYDITYTFDHVNGDMVVDEIYPTTVDKFKKRFPRVQVNARSSSGHDEPD